MIVTCISTYLPISVTNARNLHVNQDAIKLLPTNQKSRTIAWRLTSLAKRLHASVKEPPPVRERMMTTRAETLNMCFCGMERERMRWREWSRPAEETQQLSALLSLPAATWRGFVSLLVFLFSFISDWVANSPEMNSHLPPTVWRDLREWFT